MPVVLTAYDYFYNQHDKRTSIRLTDIRPARFLFPAVLLSCGNLLTALTINEPRSTYICQYAWFARSIVPITQLVGLSLDCYILICIEGLIKAQKDDAATNQPYMSPVIVALILIVSAGLSIEPWVKYNS